MAPDDRAPRRTMRERLAPLYHSVVDRALQPVTAAQARLQADQRRLARELRAQRATARAAAGRPIRVVLLCHEAAFWGKLAPVHRALADDDRFEPVVVAMAWRHTTFGDDAYHDTGAAAHIRATEGVEPVVAHDPDAGTWIDLQDLRPDYVVYPTPYDKQYPPSHRSATVELFATTCYVPYYGTLIYQGDVATITHPAGFFDHIGLAFVPDDAERHNVLAACGPADATVRPTVHVTGVPAHDLLTDGHEPSDAVWNLPERPARTRILWTPRWRIGEGTSHFLEYHAHLLDWATARDDVDLVLRPHPLLYHQLTTNLGWSRARLDAFVAAWEDADNARIDTSGDYVDTLLTADVLVSDISSMLVEFAVTAKPIVYTHKRNDFNALGRRLAEGFDWVRTVDELDATLERLIAGDDPLADRRAAIATDVPGARGRPVSRTIVDLLAEHDRALADPDPAGPNPAGRNPAGPDPAGPKPDRSA